MYVSGREVAAMLGLGRETAQRVLASGLAGEPVVTSAAKLYERSRVDDLDRRPEVTVAHVRRACPEGIMVGRLDPRRTGPEGPWRASPVVQAMIRILAGSQGPSSRGPSSRGPSSRGPSSRGPSSRGPISQGPISQGSIPLVVTVGPFVLSCHDTVGCASATGPGRGSYTSLELREPGTWSRNFEDRILCTPPGNPLLFWACSAMPPIRRTRRPAAAG